MGWPVGKPFRPTTNGGRFNPCCDVNYTEQTFWPIDLSNGRPLSSSTGGRAAGVESGDGGDGYRVRARTPVVPDRQSQGRSGVPSGPGGIGISSIDGR